MLIHVSYLGGDYDRTTGLPTVLHLDDGATLSRAIDVVQRQSDPDTLLPSTRLVAVNGQHAGTLAAPDHRELEEGDQITISIPATGP